MAGFIGAGLIVNTAFSDWSENPVITSVDSIAAPIDSIQFPTVTICHDEKRQPDNWAFLETIFNNMHFECITSAYTRHNRDGTEYWHPPLPYCNTTEKVREDFRFLVKGLAEQYKGWLFNDDIMNSELLSTDSTLSMKDYEGIDDYAIDDIPTFESIANKVGELVANKVMNTKQLMDFSIDSFAKTLEYYYVLDTHWKEGNFSSWDEYGYGDCSSKKCKNNKLVKVLVKLLSVMGRAEIGPFGNFLSYFLSKVKLDKKLENTFKYGKMDSKTFWKSFCTMGKNEKFVHMLFTNMSKLVGFDENELVSLYDLPSMLSNANDKSTYKFQHNFLYSTCQDSVNNNGDNPLSPTMSCYYEWQWLFSKGRATYF